MKRTNKNNSFRQAEAFPLIARCIERAPIDMLGFVDHATIVTAILADPELDAKGDRWFASNMLQWFSQKITVGNSVWVEFFDREARAGGWAYRSKAWNHPQDLGAIKGDPQSPPPRELGRVS